MAVANLGIVDRTILPTIGELDQWRYCPRCAAEVQIESKEGRADCPSCGFRAYAGSKPTAGAVCFDELGRVLLARRAGEPSKGCWDFPGGFLDENEHPLACLRRELQEEAGIEVEPLEFLGVWVDRYGGDGSAAATLNLYWTARIVYGEPEPADDVAELRWFRPDEIPLDELAFDHLPQVLSAWNENR